MKLTIPQKTLAEAVAIARGFISSRTPLPILHCIKLVATAQTLTLEATDLDTAGKITLAAEVAEPGSLCVSGSLLGEVAGKLPAGDVEVRSLGEGRCTVSAGGSRYELATRSPDDWPEHRTGDATASATLSQPQLAGLISQAVVAAAKTKEEARAVMTGVSVALDLDRLTMVSTDGRRLAVVEEVVQLTGESQGLTAIIPADALRQLARVLGKSGEVTVTTSDRHATFTLPGYEFRCGLLEGRFPDHTKVVPTNFERSARLSASDLSAAIKRLLPLAQEKKSPGLLRLRFGQDGLVITANTPDLGSGEERVECDLDGETLLIGFNGHYLLDGLAVLSPGADVEILLQGDTQSAVIRQLGEDGYRYVAMPVKLRDVEEAWQAEQAA